MHHKRLGASNASEVGQPHRERRSDRGDIKRALGEPGRREQLGHYKQLAAAVSHLESNAEMIVVQFDHHLDRDLFQRTLAVERECCPFFVFQLDDSERRLQITVRQPEHQPALEAMAAAFSAVQPAGGRACAGKA